VPPESALAIESQVDVEHARRWARTMARSVGFGPTDTESVVLSVSELATNLLRYAQAGLILLTLLCELERCGICVESRDTGPGIENLDHALADGFSTRGGLGSGIASVRRLMDDFVIESGPSGTVIVANKWVPDH